MNIMVDPVIIESGITYERSSIEEWFLRGDTCPMTGLKISNKRVIPNITLKQLIQDFFSQNSFYKKKDRKRKKRTK